MKRMNHIDYPRRMKSKTDAQLRFIVADAALAAEFARKLQNGNEGYYLDEVHYAAMELDRRRNRRQTS